MTDHSKYINHLKDDNDMIRNLTDQLPIGIFRTSYNGDILYANPALARMFEYEIDEFYKLNSFQLFLNKEDRNTEIKSILRNSLNKITKEQSLKTKSGKVIIVKGTITVIRDDKGKIQYFDGLLEDVSAQKEAEKEILKLSTAITQSPASVIITDLDGNIEYVNPKFNEVTGYSTEEVIGKNPRILKTEFTTSEDYKELWETISSGNTWTGEFLNKRKDGTNYWEHASISPIIDDNGNTIKYLAIKEDVTKRKEIEDALIKSENELKEANATKNMFFSIMAHDLKGPIGNVLQLSKIIKNKFNDISNQEILEYINLLFELSTKTDNLLNDLLLWAQIQMNIIDFETSNIGLELVINESINMIEEKAKEKDIKIKIGSNIDADLLVHANKDSIKTIFRNLLSNAVKFSKIKGEIEINISPLENNFIEISIQDNGVGISSENIAKLFKIETSFSTYGTNQEKGTGMGLIICSELIKKNGGTIRVESKENFGSTFYFTLPIQK